jgi:anti-sigma factor RsiW
MNESQMIEDLRSALDDATSHVGARPGLAERARAAGRRRRTVRGLLAGVPAVALVAGAAFAVHGSAPASTSASTGVVMPAHSAASSSPGSVQLTSYQTTVLAKAHVTKANLAVLKKMHLTPLQIKALGVAYRTAQQIGGGSDKQLTVAQIAAVVKVKPTVAQLAALGYANLTVGQIEAIAKADLTAAQLAALGG